MLPKEQYMPSAVHAAVWAVVEAAKIAAMSVALSIVKASFGRGTCFWNIRLQEEREIDGIVLKE